MVAFVKRPPPSHIHLFQRILSDLHPLKHSFDCPVTDEDSMVPTASKPTLMTEFTKLNATTNNEREKRENIKAEATTLSTADTGSINTFLFCLTSLFT